MASNFDSSKQRPFNEIKITDLFYDIFHKNYLKSSFYDQIDYFKKLFYLKFNFKQDFFSSNRLFKLILMVFYGALINFKKECLVSTVRIAWSLDHGTTDTNNGLKNVISC